MDTARGGVQGIPEKGRGVRVVGRLKQDRCADPDGKQYSRVSIVAEHVEFKPQLMKQVGDPAAAAAEHKEEKPAESAEEEQEEKKEAASF